jgi:hypothetical protein
MERWQVADELTTDLERVDKIVVRVVAGDVTVTPGPSPRIEVRRESGSDVFIELNNGTLFIAQPDPDLVGIERLVKYFTEGRRHRCTVAIVAPPEASVQISTVSAEVIVSGFSAGTTVKTVSGDVTLAELRDDVDIQTVSGDIQAKDIIGGMKLKTVSGGVAVVDGTCRWVDAKTVSGDVLLDLDLDPAGTYDASTVSGTVSVRTIAEPNLRVDVTTVSGHLTSDFGLGFEGGSGKRRISQTLGDGGARLGVKTVSGDLRVLRGRAAPAA